MAKSCAEFADRKFLDQWEKPNPDALGESGEVITEKLTKEIGYTDFKDSKGNHMKFVGAKNGFDHVKKDDQGNIVIIDTKNISDRNPLSCLDETKTRGVQLTNKWLEETAKLTADKRSRLSKPLSKPKIYDQAALVREEETTKNELAEVYKNHNIEIANMITSELENAKQEEREPNIRVIISHVDQETGSVTWLEKKKGTQDKDIKSNDSWEQIHYLDDDQFDKI